MGRLLYSSSMASIPGNWQYEERSMFTGLTELNDAAVEALSRHRGDLSLDGLTELSDAAAEALSRHQGTLYLDGLTELSDA